MSYAAAIDRLFALTQELAHGPALASDPGAAVAPAAVRRKFDLDHMRILARALGDPQTRFPSILIAGTNGKGSTAATLASILSASGLRTGLYTSPHLNRVTERIRVSTGCHSERSEESPHLSFRSSPLHEISEPEFARLYFRVDDAARALVAAGQLPHHPSFFETLTALAFLSFADEQPDGSFGEPVDIAVLEVGLGGRLDATNIVTPLLSVITDIALDHQDYLGTTIAEIAREKAGILRANGTLITLPQHAEANQSIGEAAVALDVRASSAAQYLPDRRGNREQGVGTSEPPGASTVPWHLFPSLQNHYTLHLGGETVRVHSPLAGQHQQRNLALAIAAAVELRNHDSYNIPNAAIEAGIANTSWPGRLEFLAPDLLLDVAHNPAGAWTLRAAISSLPDAQPRTLIFSCLRDKDLTEISRILFPLFDAPHRLVLTPIDNPRAASLDALVGAAAALDIPAQTAPNAAEALALARTLTPPGGLIVATGSIYLIGALREAALAPGT